MTKKLVAVTSGLSLPQPLADHIDRIRGYEPRSSFIERILEETMLENWHNSTVLVQAYRNLENTEYDD